jgi:hypothetical protein
MFQISNSSGYLFMREIPAFTQEDLINDDVYLLDAYDVLYAWIGNRSNKFERKGVINKACQYIDGLQDSRDKSSIVINEVEAGREPPGFILQFMQWEPEFAAKWLEVDQLEKLKAANASTYSPAPQNG